MRARLREIRGKLRYLWSHPGFRRAPASTVFRLMRWTLHCALGIPSTVNLRPWGVRFFLPARWRGAGTTMIFVARAQYERELAHLHRFLAPGMVVVDGGASCGIYTVAAARLVGASGRVLSFEPGAEAFSVLKRNIELNHLMNVRAHCAALSDKDGTAELYHHEHGPNSFSLGKPQSTAIESEQVVTLSLDEVFRKENAARLGFIKLDVEGAEELVLRGAGQIIAHSFPTILFEANAAASMQLGLQPHGAWELLMNRGYRFFSLAGCGDLCELDKPPRVDTIDNIIAVHGKRCGS
ncbi:MAG: FkbM family methyltransferase [Candidatus Acidiferrum sp.]